MATQLHETPSRVEILHLIQQYNKLNPAPTQQIPLHLSPDEDIKLSILQQEQKLRKRNFNAVQRSGYLLRRCIEDVLRYDASTSSTSYDRDTCVAATRDFLRKLEAEMEAVESLKDAVQKAKILEDEQREAERTTKESHLNGSADKKEVGNNPYVEVEHCKKVKRNKSCDESGETVLGMIEEMMVNAARRKPDGRRQRKVVVRETLSLCSSSGDGNLAESAGSLSEIPVTPEKTTLVQLHQADGSTELSQDILKVMGQPKSSDMDSPTDPTQTTLAVLAPQRVSKGILKKNSSFGELPYKISEEPGKKTEPPEVLEEKLDPISKGEALEIKRDIMVARSLRRAHERGLKLYSEVIAIDWNGTDSETEA